LNRTDENFKKSFLSICRISHSFRINKKPTWGDRDSSNGNYNDTSGNYNDSGNNNNSYSNNSSNSQLATLPKNMGILGIEWASTEPDLPLITKWLVPLF